MKYRIQGADRATGNDIEAIFEADNADGACAKASGLGILVTTCSEESGGSNSTGLATGGKANRPPVPPAHPVDGRSIIHKPLTIDLLLLIAGWILVAGGTVWFGLKLGQGYGGRFSDENAAGATANASEALWVNLVFGLHLLAGLGLFVLRYMRRVACGCDELRHLRASSHNAA